jgi:hypothetical protein
MKIFYRLVDRLFIGDVSVKTYSMVQGPFWKICSCFAGLDISPLGVAEKLSTVFTKATIWLFSF